MGGKKKVTIGHRYFLGMHMVSSLKRVDAVRKIFIGEKLAWEGNVTSNQDIIINKPNLFGGEMQEGGISGTINVEFGEDTQGPNAYLGGGAGSKTVTYVKGWAFDFIVVDGRIIPQPKEITYPVYGVDPIPVPAFRGVLGFVLNQVYIGTSKYIKPWAFECSRIPAKHWYPSVSDIDGDANPAHIIYECLTDESYGLGYGPLDLDDESFRKVALALYNEGFGLSFVWAQEQSMEEFINEVLKHLDATLFVDPSSGLFTLRLIRDDYDVNSLATLDESNIIKLLEYSRPGLSEAVNQVILTYKDRHTNNDSTVTVQDLALFNVQGSRISTKVKYLGISNAETANLVAQRELNQLSSPIAKLTIETTRDALSVHIGDAFKWSWKAYGIESMIMRVISLDQGSLSDGKIRIQATEDVFASATQVFAAPKETEWVDPTYEPVPVSIRMIEEAVYALSISANGLGWLPPSDGYGSIVVLTGESSPTDIDYDIYASEDGGVNYNFTGTGEPFAYIILQDEVKPSGTELTISFSNSLDTAAVGDIILMNAEYMQILSVTSSTITVSRALFDTAPVFHQASSIGIIANIQHLGLDARSYLEGDDIRIKLVSRNSNGELPLADALIDEVLMNSRFIKPYVPAYLTVNSEYFPEAIVMRNGNADYVFEWRHRDRVLQADTLVGEDTASIGPEAGTTYTISILDTDTETLLRTISGIVPATYTYAQADQVADGGASVANLTILLTAQRDAYNSYRVYKMSFLGISPDNDPTKLVNWLELSNVPSMATGYAP